MRPAQENWVGNMAAYDMMVITLKGLETYSKTTDLSNLS